MAITAEVEVLCQQLKGRGMYTVPSATSTTSSSKAGAQCALSTNRSCPEVISPGHGPVAPKFIIKPTR